MSGLQTLVLNADYRPLSYHPLSLWSWKDAISALLLDRVNLVESYDSVVRSPSVEFKVPSVVALKSYVTYNGRRPLPAITSICAMISAVSTAAMPSRPRN